MDEKWQSVEEDALVGESDYTSFALRMTSVVPAGKQDKDKHLFSPKTALKLTKLRELLQIDYWICKGWYNSPYRGSGGD